MNRYDEIVARLDAHYLYARHSEWVHLSEAELAQLESDIGYELPADYREFLRDYGVSVVAATFPLEPNADGQMEGGVSLFFGAGRRIPGYEILDENSGGAPTCSEPLSVIMSPSVLLFLDIEPGVTEVDWPGYILKIEEDGGTNVYLILDGPRKNWVIYGENDAGVGIQKFFIAARSFDEFMNSLTIRPEQDY